MQITRTIIGLLYAFAYKTAVKTVLSTPIKWGAWGLTLWIYLYSRPLLWLAVTLLLSIYLFYWRAKQNGYKKFIPIETDPSSTNAPPLPANKKIKLYATGTFGTADEESFLLLRPAAYWQVSLGEHVVMVSDMRGKYAYQFFSAAALQEVQDGMLLHGRHPLPTLAITYRATWVPSDADLQYNMPNAPIPENAPSRTIYFTFNTVEDKTVLWNNIVH